MKKKVRKEKKPKTIKAVKKGKTTKKSEKKVSAKKEEKLDKNKSNPIINKREEVKDKNIQKINMILKDDKKEKSNEFDLLFLIDATGSMGPYINAARNETENISKELRKSYPEMNFQYGYIFYRDPVDSKGDKHEVINLTDNVNSLPEKIKKIIPSGGGDLPEDWVGAYKRANEEISWRNGKKVIIHLADAGAHGKEFTPFDKYRDEGEKLMYELDRCFENKIKIFGYVLTEDARNSFNECQKIFRKKGGEYEICDFILENKDFSDIGVHDVYTGKKSFCKRKKLDFPSIDGIHEEDHEEGIFGAAPLYEKKSMIPIYQSKIDEGFKSRVMYSVCSVLKKE
jgi:Mg-chelatase subunit ChlD